MKIKFNWGTNIAIVYILFLIITIGMAAYMMSMDVELVTEDYYEKELVYQERIDAINRAAMLPEKMILNVEEDSLKIVFPKIFPPEKIKGEVDLYRPSNEKMDVKFPIALDSTSTVRIPREKLSNGFWKVKVDWKVNSVQYFNEFKIILE